MYRKFLATSVFLLSVALLSGCSGDSKEDKSELKRIQTDKEPILSYYEDDIMEKYIYEDKSEEELRLEIVEDMLGIQHSDSPLARTGIKNNQGLVVETGVLTGGYIPPFTSLDIDLETDATEYDKTINEQSLQQFTDILITQKKINEDERYVNDTELLLKKIEKRKQLIGKEKPLQDLDIWSFNDKIEQRYQDDLKELRRTIQEKRELEQAKAKVKILQEQVESINEKEKLKYEMDRLDKQHNEKIDVLAEQEKLFKEKLDKDKELTENEKKGIKEDELDKLDKKEGED